MILKAIDNTKPMFNGTARFFVVKSNSYENLETSIQHGAWATTMRPTKKLTAALKSTDHVILIFSINESSCFQGIARMERAPDPGFKPELFKNQPNSSLGHSQMHNNLSFMSNFKISWLMKCTYPFRELENFPVNELNEGQPIYKSFNG